MPTTNLGLQQCEQLLKMLPNPGAIGCKEWLKLLCSKFQQFCHELHRFLATGSARPSDSIHETISLSCSQIVDCIYWLEQTAQQEIRDERLLSTCRSHFSGRIQRCLRTLLNAIDSHRLESQHPDCSPDQTSPHFQMNLVASLDFALDLLQPLAMFADTPPQPQPFETLPPARCAQLLSAAVHSMLANVRLFARHCREAGDRRALLTLAATVRRQCSELGAAMLATKSSPPQLTELRATALESTLYQLDTLLNEALLRLICHVFSQAAAGFPASTLPSVWRHNSSNEPEESAAVASLRLFCGRLQQIGHIAALFSHQPLQRCRLRTSLAAIEEVLAATGVMVDADCRLLQRHWTQAVARLQRTVFRCVDTQAFCGNLLDQLAGEIGRQQRGISSAVGANGGGQCRAAVLRCLGHCAVLQQHLAANGAEFGESGGNEFDLDGEESPLSEAVYKERRRLRDDFALMVAECRAAAAQCEPLEWRRVVKRLRVLHSVLRRLRANMRCDGDDDDEGEEDGVFGADYSAKVVHKDCSLALANGPQEIAQSSRANGTTGFQRRAKSAIRSANPLPRKSSMRTAMFKRLQPSEEVSKSGSLVSQQKSLSVDDSDIGSQQSFDCNITDILAQLAEVSGTL